MRLLTFTFLSSLLLGASPATAEEAAPTAAEKLFATQVRPLLTAKCFACHGGDREKIEGELDLTTRAGMLKGGSTSNEVLVPGNAEQSLLYGATTWKNPDLQMPPKENDRLTEEQTWLIRDWIKAGAPWPDDERLAAIAAAWEQERADGVQVPTSGGLSEEWTKRRYKPENLWAYQPLHKPAVPADATSSNPIDAFITAEWPATNITPAPLADRRTLIRRVTYNLLGLPPTPAEIAAFVDDPAEYD
ncbi:MAG TPA: c-type cytochrome domain-containing protein, partial [Nitrospiraceae bacterium]|nr:c-type cytochrome domain-containing protein [Nitrospiraceae bacterium]